MSPKATILVAAMAIFNSFINLSHPTCLPLTTDGSLCANPPGTTSSDGFDDVCVLVGCCNGGNIPAVEIPSGKSITCNTVNCTSVCSLSNMRASLGGEACTNTCNGCSPGAKPGNCIPSSKSSKFYKCLEAEYTCEGTQYAYLIDYGYKFCKLYQANLNKFDAKGKKWVHDVRLCLQEALVKDANCQSNCQQIYNYAFASHPRCYVDNGVCTLGPGNWKAIVDTVQLQTLFGTFQALVQSVETAASCAKFYAFLVSGHGH